MFQSNYTVYFFSSARGVQRIFPDCSGEVYRGVIPNMIKAAQWANVRGKSLSLILDCTAMGGLIRKPHINWLVA